MWVKEGQRGGRGGAAGGHGPGLHMKVKGREGKGREWWVGGWFLVAGSRYRTQAEMRSGRTLGISQPLIHALIVHIASSIVPLCVGVPTPLLQVFSSGVWRAGLPALHSGPLRAHLAPQGCPAGL
jgi:hypothetical protein